MPRITSSTTSICSLCAASLGAGLDLGHQPLDTLGHLGGDAGIALGGATNGLHLLQGALHGLTFALGFRGDAGQGLQTARHLFALAQRRRFGGGTAAGQAADFLAGTRRDAMGLAHQRLQLGQEAIDRTTQRLDLIALPQLQAAGQIALPGPQIVQRPPQHADPPQHPTPQHQRHGHDHHHADPDQAEGDLPAQRARQGGDRFTGIATHDQGRLARAFQARRQGRRTALGRGRHAAGNQIAGVLDQGRGIQHLGQGALALPHGEQASHALVLAIEIAGQILALGVLEDHEEHLGIALRPPRQVGQSRHIGVPHRLGRHAREQFGQILRIALEGSGQGLTHLLPLARQTLRKPLGQPRPGLPGQLGKTAIHLAPGLAQGVAIPSPHPGSARAPGSLEERRQATD